MRNIIYTILILISLPSFSQKKDTAAYDLYELSLEELMNIKLSVSKTSLSLRETPSVISVITREEIKKSGARDLTDVLNQVPGFNFGIDVLNVVGLGSRGNWGHEGKILLLIDGNEMNEILFATTQFGQHYDISHIDRIEIIRGPGSSLYGGYAELGVINIITRKGNAAREISIGGTYGVTGGTQARKNVRFNFGNGDEKVNYSVSGIYGEAIRSNHTYSDIYGNQIDLSNASMQRPLMLNGNFNAGPFSASLIYDGYYVTTADQFDQIYADQVDKISFNNFFTSLKYNAKLNDKITITPKLNYKTGSPWQSNSNAYLPYDVDASRLAPSISASINPNKKVELVLGADSYFDYATNALANSGYFASLGKDNSITFNNVGIFAQAVFKTLSGNLTVGARSDKHSQFGFAFSPRIGFTKAWDRFHYKLLYSRAFRSPSIENIRVNPAILPERTGVAEVELGFKFDEDMTLTANGYYIQITDPIVYFVDIQNSSDGYGNFDQGGSVGFEIDYRVKSNWGFASINYAYYSSKGINKVPYYSAVISDQSVLAMPGSRLNLIGNIKLSDVLSINPSLHAISKRYAITGVDQNDNYVYSEIGSQLIVNLFLRARLGNFDGGIGMYNFLDERQVFIQPYSGGHAPLPGMGREAALNVQYTIPLTK